MKIKRYNNTKEEKLRESLGLPNEPSFPSDNICVTENLSCENTFSYAPPVKDGYKSLNAESRLHPADKHTLFKDYGASAGAESPNTEVNVENQEIISEIPKRGTPDELW